MMRRWCARALLLTSCVAVAIAELPYRAVEGWGAPPLGTTWGEVSAVATDTSDRVFVLQRGEPPIVEFDPAGMVQKTWGRGKFVWPHGMRIDRYGFLWVTDGRADKGRGQQVFKYTRDGQLVMTLGTAGVAGNGPRNFDGPTDVAIAPAGEIFVADGHGNSRIVKFSKDGQFLKAWGRKGNGPGEFNVPHTLCFDANGRLLVGDRLNRRIQIFDQEGTFLEQWTQFGSPSGIFVAPDNTLYVVDLDDKKRLFIGNAGDGSIAHAIGNLTLAEGLAVDRQGNIYVGETEAGRADGGLVTGRTVRKLVKN